LRILRSQYDRLAVYREEVIVPLGLSTMIVQALLFAWVYPRLFDTARDAWIPSALQFAAVFGVLAWSLAVLPAAAKYRMTSVWRFVALESCFTVLHFLIVSPLIALAWRAPA